MNISTKQFNLAVSDGKIYLRVKDGSQVVISNNQRREVVVTPVKNPEAEKPKAESPVAKKIITPKVGYVMLKTGDLIKKGDFISIEGYEWIAARGMIGKNIGTCSWEYGCRKAPASYPTPPKDFRVFTKGEVKKGDLVWWKSHSQWEPADGLIGEKIEKTYAYGDKWYGCRKKA